MRSVDTELMRPVEEVQLRERPELAPEPESLRLMHLVEEEFSEVHIQHLYGSLTENGL